MNLFLDLFQRTSAPRRMAVPDIPTLAEFVQQRMPSTVVYTPMDTSLAMVQQRALNLLDDVVISGPGAAIIAFVAEPCAADIRRDPEPRRCFGRHPNDPWGVACAATALRFTDGSPLPVFVVPLVAWITMPVWADGAWSKVAARGVWELAWRFTPNTVSVPAPRPTQAGLWSADDDQQLVQRPPRAVDPR